MLRLRSSAPFQTFLPGFGLFCYQVYVKVSMKKDVKITKNRYMNKMVKQMTHEIAKECLEAEVKKALLEENKKLEKE